jgi:hypothetical protein
MNRARGLVAAGATGVLAALGALAVATPGVALRPGTAAWSRLALGARDGTVGPGLVVRWPGLERREGDQVLIEPRGGGLLGVAVDRGPLQPLRAAPGQPLVLPLSARPTPGLRLDIRPLEGEGAPAIAGITLRRTSAPSPWPPLLAGAAAFALVLAMSRRFGSPAAVAVGLFAAALIGLAGAPAHLLLSLPDASALARLLAPLALLAAAGVAWRGLSTAERVVARRLALVLAAAVLGAGIRGAFLASPGSWDTEYWKAWTLRATSAGVTRVYGDPDAVAPGHALAQMGGREEPWKVRAFGRDFVVDYPPLAMALWRTSWWAVTRAAPAMDPAEAQNAAVKLPAVLGDLLAMAVLVWAFPHRPWRGLALASLYWALPVSWFASAVLGYLDGAYAPLAAAAVVSAGRGRPVATGAWLALACLVKPTAVVIAPALLVALVASRAGVRPAVTAGLLVVLAALVPFALAGTLTTAVVHVYRILFQGTLSGGFANPWWAAGHLLNGGGPGPVAYARLAGLSFDPRPLGTALFAAAAALVVLRHRRAAGLGAAALASAALVFAYGILAIGVHDNHPYPLLLLLLLTGLPSRRLLGLAAILSTTFVLNTAALSGMGRLGPRHEMLEPLARTLAGLRMALGFDLTLALAALHSLLFVLLLSWLGDETRRLAASDAAAPA